MIFVTVTPSIGLDPSFMGRVPDVAFVAVPEVVPKDLEQIFPFTVF
jgi:hypothetical protein